VNTKTLAETLTTIETLAETLTTIETLAETFTKTETLAETLANIKRQAILETSGGTRSTALVQLER
jgi:3'-phosphoadenosine 5'-phosphosulfate sulfotransferase (PAPS reductase)/FAD synthetase